MKQKLKEFPEAYLSIKEYGKDKGLYISDVVALVTLNSLGETTIGSLAEALTEHGAQVTKIVHRLNKKQLITMRASKDDNRVKVISVSKRGSTVLDEYGAPAKKKAATKNSTKKQETNAAASAE